MKHLFAAFQWQLVMMTSVLVLATSCSLLSDSGVPDDELVGLGPGAVTGMWGPPDAVGYLDGKLLVTTDKDSPPVDFASYRVSYDFVARNRRVWFDKGVVDTVVILDSQERPSTGTVAEPAE